MHAIKDWKNSTVLFISDNGCGKSKDFVSSLLREMYYT